MTTTWDPPHPEEPRGTRRRRETAQLARLAPGGVLLTARAQKAGWPEQLLYRRLRQARWQPIHPDAWDAPGRLVDWLTHARIVQTLQPFLVCSHLTAAALHLVEVLGPPHTPYAEFTDPRPGPHRLRSGTRVHHLPIAPADLAVRRGLRTTSVTRTVGDLIRRLPRDESVAAADSAPATRTVRGVRRPPLLRASELRAELAAPRRHGALRARAWLPLTDPRSGSPAETVARLHLHDAGLHPETQATLHTPSGRTLHPDFFFRAQGLVVEVEGYAFHGTREAHTRDLHRFNDLQGCPEVRRVVRFTAQEVFRHPARMVTRIHEALAGA